MKVKDYKYGQDARDAIVHVAKTIGDTVGKTLGPAGRNYLIPNGVTNDGRTIISHIRFPNECDDSAAVAFEEIAIRTDRDGGDGTTTATVIGTKLAETIIPTLPDLDAPVPGQKSVLDIGRQLEEEKTTVIEALKKRIVPVKTLEQLEQVAFTAMEDREVAKIVAKALFEAGPDSFTALDEGFTGKVETSVQPGIEVPVEIAAPFMFNKGYEASYENVPVLVVNHLFEEYRELTPFLNTMLEALKGGAQFPALVIVAKQYSIPFVQSVSRVYQGSQGKINILLLSNKHLEDAVFEDVAAFTDAQYLDTHPKGNKKITDAQFKHCGFVGKVIATKKGTVLLDGRGTKMLSEPTTRVIARTMEIEELLKVEKSPEKRIKLQTRISELKGGKATVYVDAPTAAEKYYLKLKVQDCMNSCKSALEGGMIRGGGLTLNAVAEELGEEALLYKALKEPYERIQLNSGGTLEIGEEVMDSYLVVKSGIESAVSVVKIVISTEGIIADSQPSLVEELKSKLFTD